jgi:hypothetical protein
MLAVVLVRCSTCKLLQSGLLSSTDGNLGLKSEILSHTIFPEIFASLVSDMDFAECMRYAFCIYPSQLRRQETGSHPRITGFTLTYLLADFIQRTNRARNSDMHTCHAYLMHNCTGTPCISARKRQATCWIIVCSVHAESLKKKYERRVSPKF